MSVHIIVVVMLSAKRTLNLPKHYNDVDYSYNREVKDKKKKKRLVKLPIPKQTDNVI